MRVNSYLSFKEIADSGKTKVWLIVSLKGGEPLGYISWYGAWRKYVFKAQDDTCIWDSKCLREVIMFLEDQMELRKASFPEPSPSDPQRGRPA